MTVQDDVSFNDDLAPSGSLRAKNIVTIDSRNRVTPTDTISSDMKHKIVDKYVASLKASSKRPCQLRNPRKSFDFSKSDDSSTSPRIFEGALDVTSVTDDDSNTTDVFRHVSSALL